jgi:hypothetical protein
MAYVMTSKGSEQPPSVHYEQCLIDGYTRNGLDIEKLTDKIYSLIIESNV